MLFVHSGQDWITGSEQCLLDLVKYLDRSRFAPIVCCDSDTLAEAARALGVPVHRTQGWHVAASRWLPSRAEIAEAEELVRRYAVRLIHANDTEPIKALLPAARRHRIPIVSHLHITIPAAERRWSFAHQVSFAVGVSHTAIEGLIDDGFPQSRATVIYNGVSPERLEQGDARQLRHTLGIRATDVVFTALGSLIPRKGVDIVLSSFARLCRQREDTHLLLCGSGAGRAELEDLARTLGVQDRTHFLGQRRDPGAVLRDATDVLVSGSRQEAFPLNVLEAAYCGLPIVATDIRPHREFLGDGGAGILVPIDQPQSMADAMAQLAAHPGRRRGLGAEGRRRVLDGFLTTHFVERFEQLYSELLARPAREFGWLGATTWPRAYSQWLSQLAARRAGVRLERG